MKWFITLIFSDLGSFIGFCILLSLVGGSIWKIIDTILYRINVQKHGWPPVYEETTYEECEDEDNMTEYE